MPEEPLSSGNFRARGPRFNSKMFFPVLRGRKKLKTQCPQTQMNNLKNARLEMQLCLNLHVFVSKVVIQRVNSCSLETTKKRKRQILSQLEFFFLQD